MAAELAAFQAVATTYGLNKAQAATYFVAVILSTDPTSLGLSTDPNPSNPGGLSDAQTYVNQFNAATNRAIVSGNFANQSASASNLNYPVVGPATNDGYKGAVNSEVGVSNLTSTVVTAEGQIAVAAAANNPALITGQNIPTTTYNLTTGIDTIPSSGVISPNATVNGLQDGSVNQTWNTGDTINGDGTTVISLIANGGTASVVTASKIASLNVNSVADTPLNATQWTDVAKVAVTNGIAATNLTITAAKLASTYSLEAAGLNSTVTIGSWASATGSSDTAKLSVAGTGNKTKGSFFTIGNANDIEAVTLATSGANFVTINAGTAATKFTSTGSGVNDITIGTASSGAKTIDFSGSSGTNKIRLGTLMNSSDVITGGTGVDKLYATFGTAVSLNPTIKAVETVALTYNAAGTFNASKWTGGTGLQITPTNGVTAAVTNLNASVAAINIGDSSAITATGDAINIGYATGSKSDVTLSVGATSTSSDPAVSTTGTITFTNNAGSLTVKSVGDAANTLGDIVANKASALTVSAPDQALTIGDLTATSATSITIDASANDVDQGVHVINAQSSLTSLTVKADAGVAAVGDLATFTAKSGTDVNLTTTITSGANTAAFGNTFITGANNQNATLAVNVTSGDAAATIGTVHLKGGTGSATGAVTVAFTESVESGLGAVTLGNHIIELQASAAGYEGNLTADVSLKTATGAIGAVAPDYTFDASLAHNNGAAVTFSATTGIGALSVNNITLNGGDTSADSLTFTGTTAGTGALTVHNIVLASNFDASTATINLDASKGNITVNAVNIGDATGTASGILSVNATSGHTLIINDLTTTPLGGNQGYASITATGAGTITLDADGSGAFGSLATAVDATGATGSFTLNALSATGSLTVSLGAAASTKAMIVTTGLGSDSITGGAGANTVDSGVGVDTIGFGTGSFVDKVIYSVYALGDTGASASAVAVLDYNTVSGFNYSTDKINTNAIDAAHGVIAQAQNGWNMATNGVKILTGTYLNFTAGTTTYADVASAVGTVTGGVSTGVVAIQTTATSGSYNLFEFTQDIANAVTNVSLIGHYDLGANNTFSTTNFIA